MAFIDLGDQFIALSRGRTQGRRHPSALRPRRRRQSSDAPGARGCRSRSASGSWGQLPRSVGEPRPDRAVRRGAVLEDRLRCCARWGSSSARANRRSRSCARRGSTRTLSDPVGVVQAADRGSLRRRRRDADERLRRATIPPGQVTTVSRRPWPTARVRRSPSSPSTRACEPISCTVPRPAGPQLGEQVDHLSRCSAVFSAHDERDAPARRRLGIFTECLRSRSPGCVSRRARCRAGRRLAGRSSCAGCGRRAIGGR